MNRDVRVSKETQNDEISIMEWVKLTLSRKGQARWSDVDGLGILVYTLGEDSEYGSRGEMVE